MKVFRRIASILTAVTFFLGVTAPAYATFLGEVELPDGSTISFFRLDDEMIELSGGRTIEKLHEKVTVNGVELPRIFGMRCTPEPGAPHVQYCKSISPNSDTIEFATERVLITAIIVAGVIYFSFFAGGSSSPAATATGSGGGGGGPPGAPGGGPI